MSKYGFQLFQEESPEVAAAFSSPIEKLASSTLDPKTKNLLYNAMKIVTGDQGEVVARTYG